MLKKGGGGGKGELLADGSTLADCGLTTSMSIYEHLWVDSAANQTAFWAEYEKMASYVKTQVRNCGRAASLLAHRSLTRSLFSQRDFLNEVSK